MVKQAPYWYARLKTVFEGQLFRNPGETADRRDVFCYDGLNLLLRGSV